MDAVAFAQFPGDSTAGDFAKADELVANRVSQALSQSGYAPLRRLHCECYRGTVLLQGTVGSYFLKQMAQAIASRIDGVRQIDNRLRVQEAPSLVIV
jgi:osmotically-inducible protein OsmY